MHEELIKIVSWMPRVCFTQILLVGVKEASLLCVHIFVGLKFVIIKLNSLLCWQTVNEKASARDRMEFLNEASVMKYVAVVYRN